MLDSSFIWLREFSKINDLLFALFLSSTIRSFYKPIVLGESLHVITILLIKHCTLKLDKVLHNIFSCR